MPFIKLLGLLILLFNSLLITEGENCLTLNGQAPVFEDNGNGVQDGFRDQTLAISRNLQFSCYGNVTGWAAYAERRGTFDSVQFQVWRLTQIDMNNGCRTYQLVGSHSFNSIRTDNKLLNITSLGGQNPIPVQPGDVVGFYGDFRFRLNVNIQSNPSTTFVSYYASSAEAASLTVASTCSNLTNIEQGTPVITAYVTTQVVTNAPVPETTTQLITTTFEPTTQLLPTSEAITTDAIETLQPPQTTSITTSTTLSQPPTTTAAHSTTTTGEIQPATSEHTDTVESTEQTSSTTGYVESSTGIGPVTTLNDNTVMSTKASEGTGETTQQELSTDNDQRTEEQSLSTILILSIVVALVSGIVVVILCLVVGKCVCRKLHHKQRRIDLTSLSLNVPDGNRDRTDSHIYCEMNEVFEKKKDRTRSFSDLDNVAAFKQLDCSCKIPHRYPMADYEVPVATIQRSPGKPYQQGGKEGFENTYETPLDAKMRMLQGGGAEFKDSEERKRLDSIYDVPRPEERKRLDSTYDVPRPVEEEEYTFMASVPLESGFTEAADDIYENI